MSRPIKAGLFEGSFIWEEGDIDLPPTSRPHILRGTNPILLIQLLNKLYEVSY